jgi:formylglycine-generating enzyme required for sulfatase activity
MAYSQWRSARDGVTYRLPTSDEWRILANGSNDLDRCTAGRINCDRTKGTASAGGYRSTNLGLRDVFGNAAEWLSDGGSGPFAVIAGPSWRDLPERVMPTTTRTQNGSRGYDDVGFRLVRDITLDDVMN